MSDPHRRMDGSATHIPLYYTAEELSAAVTKMFTRFVTEDHESQKNYATLLSAVAAGKIIAFGIIDDEFAFGYPSAAPWLNKEKS